MLLVEKGLKESIAQYIDAAFHTIMEKVEAEVRIVGSVGHRLFAVTDLDAPRYKIIEIDLTNPSRNHWKEIVPESKDLLEGAELAGGNLVVKYLVDAKNQLFVFDLDGKKESEIALPAIGTVGRLSGDPDRPELFYMFTSFLYPSRIYRYDVSTGQNEVFQKPKHDFDASHIYKKPTF